MAFFMGLVKGVTSRSVKGLLAGVFGADPMSGERVIEGEGCNWNGGAEIAGASAVAAM